VTLEKKPQERRNEEEEEKEGWKRRGHEKMVQHTDV
jgi:hypothetical protein